MGDVNCVDASKRSNKQWQTAPVKVIGDFGEGHFGKEAEVETGFRQQ